MKQQWSGLVGRGVVRLCLALSAAMAWPVWAATLSVTVVDGQGRPVPETVVFLDSPEAARAVKPLAAAEMAQKDKAFVPSVLVVPKGSSVAFPNRDTVRHHVYSFSPAKRFELRLYLGTPANPVLFDQAGVVVLGCNIHDPMLAHIVVVDTPWYGVTDAAGALTLRDVPAGAYRLRAWHSRMPVGDAAQEQAQRLGADTSSVNVVLHKLVSP
jgi:plastocyanin